MSKIQMDSLVLLPFPAKQFALKTVRHGYESGKSRGHIHSKSKKVCGFHFSVSKNLRKKCVNRDDKISRQKCVNQSKVIRNASFENKMSK